MVDNDEIRKINKMLRSRMTQRFGAVLLLLIIIVGVSYFGTHKSGDSQAATPGALSLAPATGLGVRDTTLTVQLKSDSGADALSVVQASISYDPASLELLGVDNDAAFPVVGKAGKTAAGTIRLNRSSSQGSKVVGVHTIASLRFKVLAETGTTQLAIDPAFSYLVRSSDNSNILSTVTPASYRLSAPAPVVTSVTPATGYTTDSTTVTVAGNHFKDRVSVYMPGVTVAAGTINVISPSELRVTLPPHKPGSVNLTFTNPDGQSVTAPAAFSYVLLGDVNTDGTVNALDLSLLLSHFGQNYPAADLNHDGAVNAADQTLLNKQLGQ